MEDAGCVTIPIKRRGALHKVSIVKYHTADGTAVAGDKYQKSEGMVVFRPGEVRQLFLSMCFPGGVKKFAALCESLRCRNVHARCTSHAML